MKILSFFCFPVCLFHARDLHHPRATKRSLVIQLFQRCFHRQAFILFQCTRVFSNRSQPPFAIQLSAFFFFFFFFFVPGFFTHVIRMTPELQNQQFQKCFQRRALILFQCVVLGRSQPPFATI